MSVFLPGSRPSRAIMLALRQARSYPSRVIAGDSKRLCDGRGVAPPKNSESKCIRNFFIQAAGLAYHHDEVVDIISPFGAVSHHASACIPLRLDDIQCFALMICRNKLRIPYKAYALIYLRKCDIINSPKIQNLLNRGI